MVFYILYTTGTLFLVLFYNTRGIIFWYKANDGNLLMWAAACSLSGVKGETTLWVKFFVTIPCLANICLYRAKLNSLSAIFFFAAPTNDVHL